MNNIFKYNVSNINKDYNFFIDGVSTALNPLENTLIFINKDKDEYLEKLFTIKKAVIILLSNIEKEKIGEWIVNKFSSLKDEMKKIDDLIEKEKDREKEKENENAN